MNNMSITDFRYKINICQYSTYQHTTNTISTYYQYVLLFILLNYAGIMHVFYYYEYSNHVAMCKQVDGQYFLLKLWVAGIFMVLTCFSSPDQGYYNLYVTSIRVLHCSRIKRQIVLIIFNVSIIIFWECIEFVTFSHCVFGLSYLMHRILIVYVISELAFDNSYKERVCS